MKNLSLVAKIGGGFGLVLILLVVVSFTGWRSLTTNLSGIQQYRNLTEETNLTAQLRENLGKVDAAIKDFIISGKEQSVQDYQSALTQIKTALETELSKNTDQKNASLEIIRNGILQYNTAAEQITAFRTRRVELVDQALNTLGPQMAQNLAAIMDSARSDHDDVAAYLAGMASRNLLNAQIAALNFLQYSRDADAESVQANFGKLFEDTKKMSKLMFDDKRLALNKSVSDDATAYIATFEQIIALVHERNSLVRDSLDRLAPEIAQQVDDIKENAQKKQQALGESLMFKGKRASIAVLVIASIALAFGAACAFFLTKVISGPILHTVSFAETMAKGDFTQSLDVTQKDEIGTMAQALNSMVKDLKGMMIDIIKDTKTLSDASNELKEAAQQLSDGANETSTKSGTVAAAAEEMSINMQSVANSMEESAQNTNIVASATEELTSTVQNISQGAEQARTIADKAVEASHSSSERMNSLGRAAEQIGRVTETITEISEQTNLLALNATIEAARAGEAGKGFAVVANEIKELAKQTAEATVDIKNQIGAMQKTTIEAVGDIKQISQIIDNINEVITTISVAVDEQQAATGEIAGKIAETSQGIGEVNEHISQSSHVAAEITKDIGEVNQASNEMTRHCEFVERSADQLNDLAAKLSQMVGRFTV